MAVYSILIILILTDLVLIEAFQNNATHLYSDVVTKCPDLKSADVMKSCSNTTDVDINAVTDKNEENVLCTIYLQNLNLFQKKLTTSNMTQHICNQTLVFPMHLNNSNISVCGKLDFLGNSTIPTKNLETQCIKLCYKWRTGIDSRCLFAYYYDNFTLPKTTLQPLSTTTNVSATVLPKEKNTNVLATVLPKLEIEPSQINNTTLSSNKNGKTALNKNSPIVLSSNKSDTEKQTQKPTEIKTTTEKIVIDENVDVGNDDSMYSDTREQDPPGNDINKMEKPNTVSEDLAVNSMSTEVEGESYFFSYFMVVCVMFIMGYVLYHNRVKVMALVLEGKRNKRQTRTRRPNSANYHKLDSNLEEALTSSCNKNSNQIIY